VTVEIVFNESSDAIAAGIDDLSILFEDDCLIAISKPPGIVVHPTSYHKDGTLANSLVAHMASLGEQYPVRPVTRLDKDTSGLILFAKNQYIQARLITQMGTHEFVKKYIGIVSGKIEKDSGTVDLPIARAEGSIMGREIHPDGAHAVTHYRILARSDEASLAEFVLETGRTHQIRVHMAALGHPIVGDTLYSGIKYDFIWRQCLHANINSFLHPASGDRLDLVDPIPEDMLEVARRFGLESGIPSASSKESK
jgi:23S rRNA pseudouridine1911/1915/1917 synthase